MVGVKGAVALSIEKDRIWISKPPWRTWDYEKPGTALPTHLSFSRRSAVRTAAGYWLFTACVRKLLPPHVKAERLTTFPLPPGNMITEGIDARRAKTRVQRGSVHEGAPVCLCSFIRSRKRTAKDINKAWAVAGI